jgi:hypothetical protein
MTVEYRGIRCQSVSHPFVPVGHPDYVWRGSADTDVQRTWRKYGWKPTEEQRAIAATTASVTTAKTVRHLRKTG